jgi:hypothetical protein
MNCRVDEFLRCGSPFLIERVWISISILPGTMLSNPMLCARVLALTPCTHCHNCRSRRLRRILVCAVFPFSLSPAVVDIANWRSRIAIFRTFQICMPFPIWVFILKNYLGSFPPHLELAYIHTQSEASQHREIILSTAAHYALHCPSVGDSISGTLASISKIWKHLYRCSKVSTCSMATIGIWLYTESWLSKTSVASYILSRLFRITSSIIGTTSHCRHLYGDRGIKWEEYRAFGVRAHYSAQFRLWARYKDRYL